MKDNMILFVADQMRSDTLHHLGNPASITPNLDSLAKEGISFQHAYTQAPVCVPSRCSFLTGLYPHTTGHRTMHYLQDPNDPNILKEMKKNGYEVVWIGRNDIIPSDRNKAEYCDYYFDGIHPESHLEPLPNPSFANYPKAIHLQDDRYDMQDDRYYSFYYGELDAKSARKTFDWNCVDQAIQFLNQRKSTKPLFLYITLMFPHPPYECEDPWYHMIDRNHLFPRRPDIETLPNKPSMLYGIRQNQHMQTWTDERYNELRATYLAMVSRFDHQFGMLKECLIQNQLYDTSNIFVFSDHGDYTGDYGIVEKVQNCFENPISNVPLIVKPSKTYQVTPRISQSMVELIDLPSTFAQIANFDLSYQQYGKSLVHLFNQEETHKPYAYCEGGRNHQETQCMELGHDERSPYYPRLSQQALEGPQHTKATMMTNQKYKYVKRQYELDEFYDLEKDPFELDNQIQNPDYQQIILQMKLDMLDWYQHTCDFVPNRKDKR